MAKEKESGIITSQQKVLLKKRPPIHKLAQSTKQNNPPMEEMMNVNVMMNTPISPTWKLYENPFYISHHKPQQQQDSTDHHNQIHKLHLPISTRKIAASFWDLTFIKPFMESELEMARAQITALKADLECERKARKKMESLNKRLARELSEERKGREALERVCQELAKDISSDKSMMNKMKREIEEERKMLRTAEIIREERVQMKLAEAKILLEEKFWELEIAKTRGSDQSSSTSNAKKEENDHQTTSDNIGNVHSMAVMKRRVYAEAENPHIRRGIKGFVEFPRVIRAIGCRSSKHLGSKLECQKAQLKLLIKQKGPVRINGLVAN